VEGLVGNTPLVRIRSLSELTGCEVRCPWLPCCLSGHAKRTRGYEPERLGHWIGAWEKCGKLAGACSVQHVRPADTPCFQIIPSAGAGVYVPRAPACLVNIQGSVVTM